MWFNLFKRKEKKLFFNTDMHSHLVPGVDDGSANINTSVFLCQELSKLGITTSYLTPHVTAITFPNNRNTIEEPFEALKQALKEQHVPLTIGHSAEYRLDELFEREVLGKDDFMLFPNDYILIENAFTQPTLHFDDLVYELKARGLHPILAHPERYCYYANNPSKYEEIHDSEVLFQCNILSFAGFYGRMEHDTAFYLLENGMVDFIGTDMHRVEHLNALKHFIGTSEYKKLERMAEIRNDFAFEDY